MDINVLSTQNWSRMFNVWIEDIQIIGLPAAITPFAIQDCILPKVRSFARHASGFVILLFALHCSSPRSSFLQTKQMQVPPGNPPEPKPGFPAQVPAEPAELHVEHGLASWYGGDGDGFAGGITASGEIYNPADLTCAHRTLPFGTLVEVENLANGKRQVLRVTDRGPYIRGRILDISQQAAHHLGMVKPGVARIRLRTVDSQGRPAPVAPALDQDSPFTIQVATPSHPAQIERLTRELSRVFGPVTCQVAQGPRGVPVKRIRAGTYPRLEQAQKAAVQHIAKFCKDRGLEYYITRED
jgi:rare lipoprotein A